MTISPGTRLGPYEILSPLGAGGMGEVWRARDTRLDRDVAIKVLPESFARNEQFRARFEREAKTISSLNHPNICTLHDVGHEGGLHYLVMELIDGVSLADRLTKGHLPVHETLRYGAQIADALDRAHRQGIVHRDLKPGNVMLTKTGAKLLDFGLARAAAEASPVQGLTEMPTQAKPLTAEGTILGTFQYMAPEQLEGQEADARTDIFALGALLYEMATGRRAFAGMTKTSLIAAIVTAQPEPISTIQPVTPPAFEHVVKTCLEKDPDARWQSAHDVASELRWISEAGSQAGVASPLVARRRRAELFLRGAIVLLVAVVGALAWMLGARGGPEARRLVVDLAPPPGLQFSSIGDFAGPAVLSPDGETIAFVMDDTGLSGTNRARSNTSSTPDLPGRKVWVRSLATGQARALSGTDGAIFPFWAPDSRRIGFATDDTLKWIDVTGGATFAICPNSLMRGGAWAPDDTILFTPGAFDGTHRVPASGGTPTPVTKVDGVRYTTHRWPAVLQDGKHFLYLAAKHRDTSRDSGDVWVARMDGGGEPRLLLTGTSNAVVADKAVLFLRQRSLYGQEISAGGELRGQPRLLAEKVLFDTGVFGGAISASSTGRITYHVGAVDSVSRTLAWIDRSGNVVEEFGEKDLFWDFDVSPDGRRIAIAIGDPSREIWVYDLDKRTRTRLTIDATWAGDPIWAPDGEGVYHTVMGAGSRANIVLRNLVDGTRSVVMSGADSTEPLTPDTIRLDLFSRTLDLSPDGSELLFGAGVYGGLWRLPINPPAKRIAVVPEGPGVDNSAKFSPDGRWIAYASNESGAQRVYVVAVDNVGRRWQVSSDAGALPEWRPDGRELYFIDLSGTMMAVSVEPRGNDLEIGRPTPLFHGADWYWYRAIRDEKAQFLAVAYPEKAEAPRLLMVEGWEKSEK
jgi:eukaryotic-like serine/threonine-protein kinase